MVGESELVAGQPRRGEGGSEEAAVRFLHPLKTVQQNAVDFRGHDQRPIGRGRQTTEDGCLLVGFDAMDGDPDGRRLVGGGGAEDRR